jgi:hypothetical protein
VAGRGPGRIGSGAAMWCTFRKEISNKQRRWPSRHRTQAPSPSLRYDVTARPGNPDGRLAPLRRRLLRGCPRGARSQPSHGPAPRSGWLSATFASIGSRRSPLQARHRRGGRAEALVTHAGCARRRWDPAQPVRFWVNGLRPEKLVPDGAQQSDSALPLRGSGHKKEVRDVDGCLP